MKLHMVEQNLDGTILQLITMYCELFEAEFVNLESLMVVSNLNFFELNL